MAEKPDSRRDSWMLKGTERGVQRWRFIFPARCDDTGEIRTFYIEYYACAPDTEPSEKRWKLRIRKKDRKEEAPHVVRPSSFAVHAGIFGDPDARYTYTFTEGEAEFRLGPPFVAKAGECLFTEFESYGSIPRDAGAGAASVKNLPGIHEGTAAENGSAVPGNGVPGADEDAGVSGAADDGFYDHEFGTLADDTLMEWDLDFDKVVSLGTGAEAAPGMQRIENTGMRWHAEGFVTNYTGIIIADDVSYRAFPDAGAGYSDVNWGSGFPSPGIWLWSSNLRRKSTGDLVHGASFAFWGGEERRVPAGSRAAAMADRGRDGAAEKKEQKEPDPGRAGAAEKKEQKEPDRGLRIDGMLRMGGTAREKDSYLFLQTPLSGTSYLKCREDENWFEWHVILTSPKAMADIRVVCEKSRMFPDDLPSPENKLRTYRRWTGAEGTATILLSRRQSALGRLEKTEELTAEHVVCSYGSYLRPTE